MFKRLKTVCKIVYPLAIAAIKANNPGWVIALDVAQDALDDLLHKEKMEL